MDTFCQIKHGSAGLLLTEGLQEGCARVLWLDLRHAHRVLQVITCLRVSAEPLNVAVVIHPASQPVVYKVIQTGVRRADPNATITCIIIYLFHRNPLARGMVVGLVGIWLSGSKRCLVQGMIEMWPRRRTKSAKRSRQAPGALANQ